MNGPVWITLAVWAVAIADLAAYRLAAYPERTRHRWTLIPGGGFVALLVIGRESKRDH